MTKNFTLIILFALFTGRLNAQNVSYGGAEIAPVVLTQESQSDNGRALWDIQFLYSMNSMLPGQTGFAGVGLFNNEFWLSKWASDSIFKFTPSGVYVNAFTINGLSGTRSFTSDGSFIYVSNNTNQIFRVNSVLQQLSSTPITIDASIGFNARFATYDSTLNAGAGGFWIGNFATSLVAIDMAGNYLDSISATIHGLTGMYGAAVDNHSPGGPYIWVSDQGGANACRIVQLNKTTGLAVALHEVYPDVLAVDSTASTLAGGAFISTQLTPNKVVCVTMVQGSPNFLAGYEAGDLGTGINDSEETNLSVYPNPAQGLFTINGVDDVQNARYTLLDVTGRQIISERIDSYSTVVDISALMNGVYTLIVSTNTGLVTTKLVKQN